MKKLLLILLLVPFAHFLHAQEGVYLTYEDFIANKLIPADGNSMNYNYGKKATAMMKLNGEKKVWKLADIYGIRFKGGLYRATHSDEKYPLAQIIMVGNLVYYRFDIEVQHYNTSNAMGGNYTGARSYYYVSKDLQSPMYFFTAHLETMDDLIAAHKDEFKELSPFMKKAKASDRSEQILQDCIKKSKEYKPLDKQFPQFKLDPENYK